MNTLTRISLSAPVLADPSENSAHQISALPVVVIAPHNQCNCRCMMCDIWRIKESQELTPAEVEQQLSSFRDLGVRWVAFTGGEPQLNPKLFTLARMLRSEGIRVTLLTAGLLLEKEAEAIACNIDDLTVSLDGPPALHNAIRRVPGAFEKLTCGIMQVRRYRPDMPITARCTVQKANHNALRATIRCAKDLGLNSISFLAADITSSAFNRPAGWSSEQQSRVNLNADDVESLAAEIQQLIIEYSAEIREGFVVEKPPKLRRIVAQFRGYLGQVEHVAPPCNAPWVSAVIEASGDVRPCFFHPAVGNIHEQPLRDIVNGSRALQFRAKLEVATNPVCRRCVCSLHLPNPAVDGAEQLRVDAKRTSAIRIEPD